MKNTLLIITAFILSLNTLNAQTDKNQSTNNKFRLSLDAGYSYRVAPVSDDTSIEFEDYVRALKSGLNLEAHFSYFIQQNWGLGITYSNFHSNGEISFSDFDGFSESYSDKINISFIAPEYLYRSISKNKKHAFIMASSIGYLNFNDDGTFNNTNLTIKGGNLGVGFGLQYDYYLTPSVALGAGINYIAGSLRKITISANGQTEEITLEDDQIENLSRLNINGGVRFYF